MVSPRVGRCSSTYEVYNDRDAVFCPDRHSVADLIGYFEISLKNMVGNGRKIALGPYAGYQIRNLGRNGKVEVASIVK